MTVIPKLSSSLKQRDEHPNQELALQIAQSEDYEAVKELIDNLGNRDKNIQSDCIKVLYEIGMQKPELISAYDHVFFSLLESKNNRLVWGAMTALDGICNLYPDKVHESLSKIIIAANRGSVIAKDHAVSILIKLTGNKTYHVEASELLLSQLGSCPPNQLAMYAENAFPVLSGEDKEAFIRLLQSRLGELEKESKRKRVERVINKLSKRTGLS